MREQRTADDKRGHSQEQNTRYKNRNVAPWMGPFHQWVQFEPHLFATRSATLRRSPK